MSGVVGLSTISADNCKPEPSHLCDSRAPSGLSHALATQAHLISHEQPFCQHQSPLIKDNQSIKKHERNAAVCFASLMLPCGGLVADTLQTDDLLSPVESSGSTTDESDRSSFSSGSSQSSESPSPPWRSLPPTSLEEWPCSEEQIMSMRQDLDDTKAISVRLPRGSPVIRDLEQASCTNEFQSEPYSAIGLELGLPANPSEYDGEDEMDDPFADPEMDPEYYWRSCIQEGLTTQDFSSEWCWSPAPKFINTIPSIVVTPPSDEDPVAHLEVKTPIQDCLFGHQLYVPFCEKVENLLPCVAPKGLCLEEYKEQLPFVLVPSITDQLLNGLFSQIYVRPGANRTGCSLHCPECWPLESTQPTAEPEIPHEAPAEDTAQPISQEVELVEDKASVSTPTLIPSPVSQVENPYWLEDDDDELPSLDDW